MAPYFIFLDESVNLDDKFDRIIKLNFTNHKTIYYYVKNESLVRLSISDGSGRGIAKLVNRIKEHRKHQKTWNAAKLNN